jgi:mannose-1-phosphate guanylyltransferase
LFSSVLAEESQRENLQLEQDVLAPLAGQSKLYVVETTAFWRPVKTPGSALAANQLYLEDAMLKGGAKKNSSSEPVPYKRLKGKYLFSCEEKKVRCFPPNPIDFIVLGGKSMTDLTAHADIVEPVYIHPSASIDVSAKVGPNVSIGPNAVIGAGVRLSNAIILNNVTIQVRK